MAYNQEEVRKQFDRLPQIVKKAIADLDMGTITDNLRQKYNLHVDQLGKIAEEITLAMVGLTGVANFGRNIKAKTGLAEDIVNLITYDINQLIFSKIRKELEELSQMQNASPAPKVTTLPPTKPVTPSTETPTPQVFDERMHGVANVPKQEVAVTPQTGDNKGRDPYREPIV
ncbi:MAG: hypothetical protein WC640_00650 [Candidatus Paceibacterota bacterium]|jgi:hypothetical protein